MVTKYEIDFRKGFLQNPDEFDEFSELIKAEEVSSFLEIGSKFGGTLWRIANLLPKGSRVVSVDLPIGYAVDRCKPMLKECVRELQRIGYDAHLFISDSTADATVENVRNLGPFDLVFIDGNHSEPYVRKDWANYGPMGRIVAFHDIGFVQLPHKRIEQIHVPIVWKELKRAYEHEEISYCEAANGIGVLWRNLPIS